MEQIRFYLDEHIPKAIADGLRRRGVDVLTVQEAGRTGMPDSEQLAFALAQRRVLLTMDSDFLTPVHRSMPHAGVVYVTPSKSIGAVIGSVMLLFDVLTSDDMNDHVEFL